MFEALPVMVAAGRCALGSLRCQTHVNNTSRNNNGVLIRTFGTKAGSV